MDFSVGTGAPPLSRYVSSASSMRRVVDRILAQFPADSFSVVVGQGFAAEAIAHAIAVTTGCGWTVIRDTVKDHGTTNRIEGACPTAATPLLLVVESGAIVATEQTWRVVGLVVLDEALIRG